MSAMEKIAILGTKREVLGKRVKALRTAGKLPAVLYGHNVENKQIEISERDFAKAFKAAGESTLVNLTVDDKTLPVLIHDVQHHYLHGRPIHVDFYAVNMTEKIKVHVPVHFIGESPAVKALGGTLVKNLSEVEVECLPSDLPQSYEVDISLLNTFEDVIRVSSLPTDDKVVILTPAEAVITNVAPPRTEAEMSALSAEIKEDVTAVEGVVKPEETATAGATPVTDEKKEKKEVKKEEKK